MEMKTSNYAAIFVLFLCALAIASIECRKRATQSNINGGGRGGHCGWNSHEIEQEMVCQFLHLYVSNLVQLYEEVVIDYVFLDYRQRRHGCSAGGS